MIFEQHITMVFDTLEGVALQGASKLRVGSSKWPGNTSFFNVPSAYEDIDLISRSAGPVARHSS